MLTIKTNQIIRRGFLTLLVALPLAGAMAADGENRPERPMGPPPEAFTACENLSEGDACSMTTPRGDMTGSCISPPRSENNSLVCAPEGGPRGGRPGGRPPRDAESSN